VRAVHEDYLRLGVDIITSNNFWTSRPRLAIVGLGDRWEEYARAAGEIAVAARDDINPGAFVAGGIAPPTLGSSSRPFSPSDSKASLKELESTYREQTQLLAETGVDLILAEYVGRVDACVAAVDVSSEVGLPVFLGVCHVTKEGDLPGGGNLRELTDALRGHPVAAVLLMCSPPDDISASLPLLRDAFDGPIGAYSNVGYGKNPEFGTTPQEQWHRIDPEQQEAYNPARYAESVREWVDGGARIVGGCCGAGPEYIEALLPVVRPSVSR
jgi:S-methylmethionine-dependent homocysteine/selenocysteine methylase